MRSEDSVEKKKILANGEIGVTHPEIRARTQ